MSFYFTAAGTRAQVRAQLAATTFYGAKDQADKVRDFLLSEVDLAPDLTSGDGAREAGLFIEASGHADANMRTMEIKVRQIWLPAVDETAEDDAA